METLKNQTRSQQNLSLVGEVILPNFEIAGSKEKKNGSFPNLASPNVDLPTEAKRRRIMGEEMSVASTVSSQVSSRSHSPTFSESLDDSFLSTPGNSPSATLKEKFRRKYGKYELVSAIDQYLLDKEIIEACQSPEEEEEEIDANTKVSLTEFRQQYKELSEWLNQMQKVTQKTIGTLSASERYLAQSQHEDLLLQSAPRFKPFNDYAKRLLQRFPGLKQEIDERVHFLKSQWSIVEQAVSSKAMWQNTDTMFKDLESDIHHFRKWLNETETKLFSLGLKPQSTDEDVQKCLADHQILQKDIESHSRYISAVLRLSDRLHDEFEDSPNHDYYLLAEEANHLQRHWHEIWLQSLECQCKLENALKNKKASISPQSFLTGWIPQNYHKEYDNLGSSLGSDDSLTLLNRGADLVDSPPLDYSCSLSTSGDTSGKDSAVVSEVEIKMSSECSDSDLDMLRKTRLKSENRDVGYSSGASVSPLPNGHTSTESDCDDIKRLIEKVDSLVGEKPKSPKRQRKVESPSKQRPPYSSCDASSEESDASVEEFSTASDDVDALFDSVLGLDYNSDASLQQNLPKLCNTVKLRQARRKKKDRPWSAIQSMDLDNVDLVELSKSESAIDRLKDASDASETPKRQLHSGSATLPRAGAKRKLYEPTVKELASFDSDCESSTCEEYETARSDMSISEEDENVVSTASFSEPTWDNYHQVYISLGEEEEQPLTWSPLEEDLEFDEEFSIQQNSSIIKEAIEKRKLKTKPKLVSQSSRHGYDSDSDFEELCYLIDESAAHLKIADNHLKKKCKDFKGSGIDINTNRYAEIIATCQTNIKCLQIVLRHLNTTDDTTEEETEKIKDLLYQWEKLYAFAIERQTQSQQLSQMNRCLEEVELELRLCEVATDMDTFSNIRDVEFCLISVQTKLESLPCLYGKLDDLKLKSSAFQLEHPAINLQHFVQEQEQAKDSLIEKQEKLNKRLPELRQMFSVWSEYVQLKAELNDLLTQKLNTSCTAAAMRSGKTDLVSEKQTLNESLLKCEEKCRALQSLRGQLMSVVNDRMKAELTNDVADFQDRLTEIDRQYRTLLWSVEQDEACTMEQTNAGSDSVAQTQVSPVSTSSSSSSPPSSWYSSRYVKAAGAFMIFGIAYLYDPDTIKRLGDLSFTLTPELKYVNGPPPM